MDANSAARLLVAASDITLVLDDKGVIRDFAVGGESFTKDREWLGQKWIETVTVESRPKVEEMLREAQNMSFADIERGIGELGAKAKEGKLTGEDMAGGTFSITNGGVFGSLLSTPIINPPQSAILGMHGIFPRPMAIDGRVEIRPMMYIALTYDHRLIDGREAVTFLKRIKELVQDPHRFLLDC